MQAILGLVGAAKSNFTWSRRDSVDQSRHRMDYDFLKELGSGGFGKVYKVKNKLDSREYALKVVRMETESDSDIVLREVQVLSGIPSNDHVVRYYAAWVEKGEAFENDGNGSTEGRSQTSWDISNIDDSWSFSGSILESTSTNGGEQMRQHLSQSPSMRDPVCNLCHSSYKDWEVSLEYWGLIDSVLQPLDLCIDCYKKSIPEDVDSTKITIRQTKILPDCLYILMEYCESSLLDAVKTPRLTEIRHEGSHKSTENHNTSSSQESTNTKDDKRRKWSYFFQLVQGLAHLHQNGIIHRDIKPSNILFHDGVVKIGDLGLATTRKSKKIKSAKCKEIDCRSTCGNSDDLISVEEEGHSSEVGTYLYQAPEVTTGQYGEKCDIYSMGVLLVELFGDFTTGMERAHVLSRLKNGIFSSSIEESFDDQQFQLVKRLLATNPAERPTCSELLEELSVLLFSHDGSDHLGTRKTTIEKSELEISMSSTIAELHEKLNEKDREILRLQNLLIQNGIAYQ